MFLSLYLNSKNVTRLIKIFELENCLQLEKEYRIPAIINDTIFQQTLILLSLTNTDFLTIEVLSKFQLLQSTRLNCLHEKYCIVTIQQILLSGNK